MQKKKNRNESRLLRITRMQFVFCIITIVFRLPCVFEEMRFFMFGSKRNVDERISKQ